MPDPTRRAVLGAGVFVAAGGLGVALGFDRSVRRKVAVPPPPPPATLVAAVSAHQRLATMCAAAVASDAGTAGDLAPLRADLAEHIDALEAVLQAYPGWRYEHNTPSSASQAASAASAATPTPTPAPAVAPTVATVRAATQNQQSQLAATCLGWPWPDPAAGTPTPVVALLGSIAACLTVHLGRLG